MKYTVRLMTLCLFFTTLLGSMPAHADDTDRNIEMNRLSEVSSDWRAFSKSYTDHDYTASIYHLNAAIASNPNSSVLYWMRGSIYSANFGQYQMAINDANMSIRIRPSFADAWYLRGHIYQMTGNYSLAIGDYGQSMSLFQQYGETEKYNSAVRAYQYCSQRSSRSTTPSTLPDTNYGNSILQQGYNNANGYIK